MTDPATLPLDYQRQPFPEDRETFVYGGPGEPILTPPRTGFVVYADAEATTPADIATPDGYGIAHSTLYTGPDGLLPQFLGPPGALRVWVRVVGNLGAPYALNAIYPAHLALVPALMHGDGPPTDELGVDGSAYVDTQTWRLYAPKAAGQWPQTSIPLVSTTGDGEATTTYVHVQDIPAAVWVMDHPLTYRPSVTLLDSSGAQVLGDVTYEPGRVTARFSAPFAGLAPMS